MKKRLLTTLTPLAMAALVGSAADATMIAGWDFSQYFDTGALSTDGADFTATLDSNYSDLDPSFGAGAESAAFGTMHMDGSFTSTNVTPLLGSGNEPFQPSAAVGGSLASNLTAPGTVDFDSHTVLIDEGQAFANSLAMIVSSAVSVVFEADLTSVPEIGSNWVLTFGSRTFSGTSSISVAFSTDGVNFTSLPSVAINAVDTAYSVSLGATQSDHAYVRLTFDPAGNPIIDNLAINADLEVPEPSMALLGFLGLGGIAALRRRFARS